MRKLSRKRYLALNRFKRTFFFRFEKNKDKRNEQGNETRKRNKEKRKCRYWQMNRRQRRRR